MALQVADRWFESQRIDGDVTLLWEPHVSDMMRCNIWHVRGCDRDLVIDTGMGLGSLKAAAVHLFDKHVTAVATHAHADHIGGHHEFDDCVAHRLEADGLRAPRGAYTLIDEDFDPDDIGTMVVNDPLFTGPLVTALPAAGYDLRAYRILPARTVREVDEGDVIDLGDRAFEILHLPGHSPGSIGLWDAKSSTLFSGDAIYDGELIDSYHHSDVAAYVRTMKRLRDLPVETVHGGHCPSFGRARLIELATQYLDKAEG